MGVILTAYGDAAYSHAGYAAQVLNDGTTTGTYSAQTKERMTGAVVAACDCGWRGETHYQWTVLFDQDAEDAAIAEWQRVHAVPVLAAEQNREWARTCEALARSLAELGEKTRPDGRAAVLERLSDLVDTASAQVRQQREHERWS